MERREGPLNDSEKRQITALKVELARVRADADAAIEQQRILTTELAHRARNMLTVIQAIIMHTLKPDVTINKARAVLSARISALARANTLLSDTEWRPMQLSDAIHNALPNLDQYAGRFDIQGPAVAIGPKAAMALTLALHELETNAIKYGALSNRSGSVDIHWKIVEPGSLWLTWNEHGGPNVQEPTRRGFGTRLIGVATARALRGTAELSFIPTGITWSVVAPLASIQDRHHFVT